MIQAEGVGCACTGSREPEGVFDQGTEAGGRKPNKKVAQGEVVRLPCSGIE